MLYSSNRSTWLEEQRIKKKGWLFFFVIYNLCKLTLYKANAVAVTLEDYFKSVLLGGGKAHSGLNFNDTRS